MSVAGVLASIVSAASTTFSAGQRRFAAPPDAFDELADRTLHLELDETRPLDGVFHRQGARHGLDETVDDHPHRLLLGEPPRLQVEQLLVGDRDTVAS